MRKPRLRTAHISLSSWSRLGLAAGLLVVFGSMIVSLFETQALSASYEQADAARRIDVDNDSFRLGLFEQQAGINAYANDARALSEQVYVDGQQLAGNVLSQFQAAAQAEQLSVEVSRVVVTAQVWQAWAEGIRKRVDASNSPIDDPQAINQGAMLFQTFLEADDSYAIASRQRIDSALEAARRERDRLFRVSISRSILGALLLVGLGLLLSRRVLLPIGQLAAAARGLAAGNAMRIPAGKRQDEVGDLSQALAAWQASRNDRERLFDLSIDLFCVAGNGYFKVLNASWEKTTGFTRAELMAKPTVDFYHPDDQQAVNTEIQQLRQGKKSLEFRARFQCKDGSYRWLQWTVAPVAEEGLSYGVARDITNQVSAEDALRASGAHIRSILDNVADGIVTLDDGGRLQSVNPRVESLFGYTSAELIGESVTALIAAPHQRDFLVHLESYLRPDKKQVRSGSHETLGRRKDGSTFPLEFIGSQMQAGQQRVFIGTLRDISEQKLERENLERRVLYDALTGLPNRSLFNDRLHERMAQATTDRKPWGLVMMDMDRFKEVNDSLGHDEGDRLLVAVAKRLMDAVGAANTIARMGGDEFAVISAEITDETSGSRLARRIMDALEAPFEVGERTIDVRASIGIAVFPEHGQDGDTLMRHADVAMYLAKRRQVGHTVYAPADDEAQPGARLGLRGELRHAISNDELFLEYMPIVRVTDGGLDSLEALIRWRHPERGLIMPAQFISAVEQTELINPLSRWVLEEALGQVVTWRANGLNVTVAVNLSSLNLEDGSLVAWLAELLRRMDIDPACLILELTETSAMAKGAGDVMHGLDQLGVSLSVDDFGTGYSSLAYLQRLPVDLIKIDRSFVSEMLANQGAASIVRSIVDLAHNLSLKAVAEGVEDHQTRYLLRQFGCDYAQGYAISRPLSVEATTEWLKAHLTLAA